MSEAENKQLHLIPPLTYLHKLLKFCYFIVILSLTTCGNEKADNSTTSNESTTVETKEESSPSDAKTILCFGDSITAGYGLDDTSDAYPALLQEKIDDLDLNYTVVNSGLSGETSAGGKGRVNWVMSQDVAVFLLELGANDGLRGVPLSETQNNLQSIIDAVKEKSPDTVIILAGMELPPNMGAAYTTEFRQLYADLAKKNNLEFIPFILENVGGIAELNQQDGIHPTEKGHKIIANTVWETLKPIVKP